MNAIGRCITCSFQLKQRNGACEAGAISALNRRDNSRSYFRFAGQWFCLISTGFCPQSPELFFAYVSEHPQEFGTLPKLDDA